MSERNYRTLMDPGTGPRQTAHSSALNLISSKLSQVKDLVAGHIARSKATIMTVTDIFLHIPKCGGSSLRTLLTQNYDKTEVFTFDGAGPELDRFRATTPEFKVQYRLLQGHVPYGAHDGIANYRYVTLLRDPVDRHFSEIRYGLQSVHHRFHKAFVSGEIPLESWATYPAINRYFENTTTRYLVAPPDMLALETHGHLQPPMTEDDLDLAKKRLLTFAAFGFAEDFSRSVLLIARALGWKKVLYAVRNVSQEIALPAEAHAAAEPFFRIDRSLLRFAREIYDERVHQAGALLAEATAELDEAVSQQLQEAPESRHLEYLVGDPVPSISAVIGAKTRSAIARFLES